MIHIGPTEYIGEGKQKVTYHHPEDPTKCIKVPKKDKKRRLQVVLREIAYVVKFQSRLPFLSPYHGTVETNEGTGYVFDLVCDEDGNTSPTLEEMYAQLDKKIVHDKINQIHQELIKQKGVVSDINPANFLVKRKLNGDYDLILVDGFGNSDAIKICDYVPFMLHNKLERHFERLKVRLKKFA